MENIRCLIADIPQVVLADIVQRIAQSRLGIEVVGRIDNKEHFSQMVHERNVDVVVFGAESDFFPVEWRDVRDSNPDMLFIGLIDDGRHAAIYINDIGTDQLINMVRFSTKNHMSTKRE